MINWLLGILFPIRCVGCRRYDEWLCPTCLDTLQPVYQEPLLQQAIIQLKYHGQRGLAVPLGRYLSNHVARDSYDVVVPVPIHWLRRLKRGYNQTELLAQQLPKPWLPALKKIKATASQAKLNKQERQYNLAGAFRISERCRRLIQQKRVLLVDDVYSTGSTTATCANVLLAAGAKSCMIAVVAYNQKK